MVCAGHGFLGNDVKEGYETADFPQDAVGTHHLSQEATGRAKAKRLHIDAKKATEAKMRWTLPRICGMWR